MGLYQNSRQGDHVHDLRSEGGDDGEIQMWQQWEAGVVGGAGE